MLSICAPSQLCIPHLILHVDFCVPLLIILFAFSGSVVASRSSHKCVTLKRVYSACHIFIHGLRLPWWKPHTFFALYKALCDFHSPLALRLWSYALSRSDIGIVMKMPFAFCRLYLSITGSSTWSVLLVWIFKGPLSLFQIWAAYMLKEASSKRHHKWRVTAMALGCNKNSERRFYYLYCEQPPSMLGKINEVPGDTEIKT